MIDFDPRPACSGIGMAITLLEGCSERGLTSTNDRIRLAVSELQSALEALPNEPFYPISTTERRQAQLVGAYQMCELLLTYPGFNQRQREAITDQATAAKEQAEKLGLNFAEEFEAHR